MRTLGTLTFLVSMLFTVACVDGSEDVLDHGDVNDRSVILDPRAEPPIDFVTEGQPAAAPQEIGSTECRPMVRQNGGREQPVIDSVAGNGPVRDRGVGAASLGSIGRDLPQQPQEEDLDIALEATGRDPGVGVHSLGHAESQHPRAETDTVTMARRARLRYEKMVRLGLVK